MPRFHIEQTKHGTWAAWYGDQARFGFLSEAAAYDWVMRLDIVGYR